MVCVKFEVNFEVNFESLFERLVYYTVIDDIKAITNTENYVLPCSRRDNCRGKFPDYHFISGFGSVYIQFTQKRINLQRIILTRK